MSDTTAELDQLRADLATIKAAMEVYERNYKGTDGTALVGIIEAKIARLEAEADPWREAKKWVEQCRHTTTDMATKRQIAYVDHLTAERDRLAARVAELEAEIKAEDDLDILTDDDRKALDSICIESIIKHDPDPILDPARVLATAAEVAGYLGFSCHVVSIIRGSARNAKPYRVKGGENV